MTERPVSPRRIEVCHVASGDRWAGAESQLAGLLTALQSINDLAVSAIFLNEGRLAAEARRAGVEVRVFPEAEWSFFRICSEARQFVRSKGIQVLHSHRYKENLIAALVAFPCHVPVHILSSHGASEPFTGRRHYKQRAIQLLDRLVARYSANRVVSVSEDLRTKLTRHIPCAKVVTVYNGIDEQEVSSGLTVSEAKQRLGIPPEYGVVGMVGRLDPVKRLDIFLAAAREIVRSEANTQFIIAGEGREEQALRQLAHELQLDGQVLFLGHRDDVFDVLRAMDVLVFCSDHEGLPMALLETLYLGVPIVARPVGGIPEVIENGVTGVFVNSSDPLALAEACVNVLRDPDGRKRMAQEGTRLVSGKFTAGKSAAEVARLYRLLRDQVSGKSK
jgi:glycosyltransferase involved in cell wall biosynthesis